MSTFFSASFFFSWTFRVFCYPREFFTDIRIPRHYNKYKIKNRVTLFRGSTYVRRNIYITHIRSIKRRTKSNADVMSQRSLNRRTKVDIYYIRKDMVISENNCIRLYCCRTSCHPRSCYKKHAYRYNILSKIPIQHNLSVLLLLKSLILGVRCVSKKLFRNWAKIPQIRCRGGRFFDRFLHYTIEIKNRIFSPEI